MWADKKMYEFPLQAPLHAACRSSQEFNVLLTVPSGEGQALGLSTDSGDEGTQELWLKCEDMEGLASTVNQAVAKRQQLLRTQPGR